MKQQILDKIDTDFVINLLYEYGSDCRNMRFKTVCHGGDGYNLQYYPDTKTFHCFSGCNETFDIFTLVSKVENISYGDAIKKIAKKIGVKVYSNRIGFTQRQEEEIDDISFEISGYKDYISQKNEIVDKLSCYYYYDPNTFYKGWIDEGISIDSMIKFGIRWDEVKKRIIIPCRNIDGDLIGVRYRTLIHDDIVPQSYLDEVIDYRYENGGKYGVLQMKIIDDFIDYRFKASQALYGLFENQNAIRKYRKAIIFEGEKSVLKCNTWFGAYPAVATYGHHLSDQQIAILADLGVEKIILAYDTDAIDSCSYICKKIKNWGITSWYIDGRDYLGEKDSPVDKSKEIYIKLLKNKTR